MAGVVSWVTSKEVIARVTRNIRNIDYDMMEDLPEWMAEAIMKLKTHYQLELKCHVAKIDFYRTTLPCNIDALSAVVANGRRLLPGDPAGPLARMEQGAKNSIYQSVVSVPQGISKIEESGINNYLFYLSSVEAIQSLPVDTQNVYRLNFKTLETSIKEGYAQIWYWSTPVDDTGFPMIPDNENYKTAMYWYCRMMMIGAGMEDKIFSYQHCNTEFERIGNRAILEITYPSPDDKRRSIVNNVSLIPHQYDWQTFGQSGDEGFFDDTLG